VEQQHTFQHTSNTPTDTPNDTLKAKYIQGLERISDTPIDTPTAHRCPATTADYPAVPFP
jgi:hypothetical protein